MGNYDFSLDLESQNTMSVINNWIKPESTVLEFGSANGRLTKYLSEEKKCKVTIVEIDEEAGSKAEKYAVRSYLGTKYGNIENFFWEREKQEFQYIIFADVLEHLNNPQKVLEKCKEVLREDGRILVSIPNITHNSIIIDMLNDKFEYSKTGLLDRTHIHFFSYKSFIDMVKKNGMFVCETVPIYSRVANNEIKNSFADVPVEIAQYLRKRIAGSIYQYVFKLSISEKDICKEKNLIEGLEIERYEELETQCYYRTTESVEYTSDRKVSKIYFENSKVFFEIDLSSMEKVQNFRWDPMEDNGVVFLEKCQIVNEDSCVELKVQKSNAIINIGKIFVFEEMDPYVEFEIIPEQYRFGKIQIEFSILAYRRDAEFYEKLKQILLESSGKENISFVSKQQQAEMVEIKRYIEHLERDIKEQKGYINHLEKDIGIQRKYIEYLEREVNEQKNYIEHLEKDISEQKGYIERLERGIDE